MATQTSNMNNSIMDQWGEEDDGALDYKTQKWILLIEQRDQLKTKLSLFDEELELYRRHMVHAHVHHEFMKLVSSIEKEKETLTNQIVKVEQELSKLIEVTVDENSDPGTYQQESCHKMDSVEFSIDTDSDIEMDNTAVPVLPSLLPPNMWQLSAGQTEDGLGVCSSSEQFERGLIQGNHLDRLSLSELMDIDQS